MNGCEAVLQLSVTFGGTAARPRVTSASHRYPFDWRSTTISRRNGWSQRTSEVGWQSTGPSRKTPTWLTGMLLPSRVWHSRVLAVSS